jgi:hypothetical protein
LFCVSQTSRERFRRADARVFVIRCQSDIARDASSKKQGSAPASVGKAGGRNPTAMKLPVLAELFD